MSNNRHTVRDAMSTLAEDTRALMTATGAAAGDRVNEAHRRLAAALEHGKEIYGGFREKAVAGTKAADAAMHEHPYRAIAVGFGIGALLGFLAARRPSRNRG